MKDDTAASKNLEVARLEFKRLCAEFSQNNGTSVREAARRKLRETTKGNEFKKDPEAVVFKLRNLIKISD